MNNERTMMKNLQEKMGWTEEELETFIDELKAKLTSEDVEVNLTDKQLEKKITTLLNELGFIFKLKGTRYIRGAIIYMLKNGTDISITKELYPCVAEMFGTTASRVERAIRHAVERAFDGGNPKLLEIFGYSVNPFKRKPSNSEFIALIVNQINQGLI